MRSPAERRSRSVSYWRFIATPIIAGVIARVGTADPKLLSRELSRAYPFGERKHHPYKIWLDEIKRQLRKGRHKDLQGRPLSRAALSNDRFELFSEEE